MSKKPTPKLEWVFWWLQIDGLTKVRDSQVGDERYATDDSYRD